MILTTTMAALSFVMGNTVGNETMTQIKRVQLMQVTTKETPSHMKWTWAEIHVRVIFIRRRLDKLEVIKNRNIRIV